MRHGQNKLLPALVIAFVGFALEARAIHSQGHNLSWKTLGGKKYGDCTCSIKPREDKEGQPGFLGTDDQIWLIVIGIPFGFVISVFTLDPTTRLRKLIVEKTGRHCKRTRPCPIETEEGQAKDNTSRRGSILVLPLKRLNNWIGGKLSKEPARSNTESQYPQKTDKGLNICNIKAFQRMRDWADSKIRQIRRSQKTDETELYNPKQADDDITLQEMETEISPSPSASRDCHPKQE